MENRLWIAVVLFALAAPSCNLPGNQVATSLPVTGQATLEAPTSSVSTSTPIPIETLLTLELLTITPTSTASIALASPKDQPVNCRFGPAISYAAIGALNLGRQAEVIGKNSDSSWWYVRNPSDPSTSCWLSAVFVDVVGNVESLPVVSPPDIMVTSINVSIEPPAMNVACDAFPQVVIISAQITATGPSKVVWHWESSTGVISPDKSLVFEAGDVKTVQDYYQVNRVDDYLVKVQTTLPNIMIGQASFKVVCTP